MLHSTIWARSQNSRSGGEVGGGAHNPIFRISLSLQSRLLNFHKERSKSRNLRIADLQAWEVVTLIEEIVERAASLSPSDWDPQEGIALVELPTAALKEAWEKRALTPKQQVLPLYSVAPSNGFLSIIISLSNSLISLNTGAFDPPVFGKKLVTIGPEENPFKVLDFCCQFSSEWAHQYSFVLYMFQTCRGRASVQGLSFDNNLIFPDGLPPGISSHPATQ